MKPWVRHIEIHRSLSLRPAFVERIRFEGEIKEKAKNLWVAECPALGIVTQGVTQTQAWTSLDDGVRMFVEHCFKMGILEATLQGLHGFEKRLGRWVTLVDEGSGQYMEIVINWGSS